MSESIELILEQLDELEEQEQHIKEANFEIEKLKNQLQQKENIIKEVREYANTDKNGIPKHIKDYINNLLDKEK